MAMLGLFDTTGDATATPGSVDYRRRMAAQLAGQATDASPKGHWAHILAQALQGGVSGYEQGKATADERAGRNAFAAKFQGGKIPDIGVLASDPWAPAGMAGSVLTHRLESPYKERQLKLAEAAGAREEAMAPYRLESARDSTIRGRSRAYDELMGAGPSAAAPLPAPLPAPFMAPAGARPAISPFAAPPPAPPPSYVTPSPLPGSYVGAPSVPASGMPRPPVDERRAAFGLTGSLPPSPDKLSSADLAPDHARIFYETGTGREVGRLVGPKKGPDSTTLKGIHEAQDELPNIRGSIDELKEAVSLIDKAYHGYGSTGISRFAMGSRLLPESRKEAVEATVRLDQIMSGGSIERMSQVLKGATTDREMDNFKRIMADPAVSADIKKKTLQAMLERAERHYAVKVNRIRESGGAMPDFVGGAPGPAGPSAGGMTAPPKPAADWKTLGMDKKIEVLRRVSAAPTPETLAEVRATFGEDAYKEILTKIQRARAAGPGVPAWTIR